MPKRKAVSQSPEEEETQTNIETEATSTEMEGAEGSESAPISPVIPNRITRSFVKQLSSQSDNKPSSEGTQEDSSQETPAPRATRPKKRKKRKALTFTMPRPRTKTVYLPHTVTAIPVNQLPQLFERVMKALPPSKSNYYEIYEIQNLIVTCALDDAQFSGKGAADALFKHVYDIVTTDEKYCRHQQEGTGSISVISDAEVLRRYDEFLDSAEQQKQRSYRNDSKVRHIWTEQEVLRFKEAFSKYGNGPTSNRKIAEYIGNGVHPNHVAYFKAQYKKQMREAKKKEAAEAAKAQKETK